MFGVAGRGDRSARRGSLAKELSIPPKEDTDEEEVWFVKEISSLYQICSNLKEFFKCYFLLFVEMFVYQGIHKKLCKHLISLKCPINLAPSCFSICF